MYQLLGTHTFRFQTIDQYQEMIMKMSEDEKSKYWASKNSNPWEDLLSLYYNIHQSRRTI